MRRLLVGALGALLLTAGCSGDDSTPDDTIAPTTTPGSAPTPVADELALDLVAPAVAALEAQLGGPQRYFEINVQGAVVNLFVAVDDATAAQPWAYIDGALSSVAAQPAQGQTFPASSVQFDPDTLLDQVTSELPEAVARALEIVGGPDDAVQYTAVMISSGGSQILVQLAPDGTVLGVDA